MLWEALWHRAGPSVDFVGTQRGPSAHSQHQRQLAASCSVSSYFKQFRSCWIHSSLSPAPLSELLSDIVFEFPGSESPAAHGHGHQPGCYNTRKHFPWRIKGQGDTELSCIPSQCVRNRVPALPATPVSLGRFNGRLSHAHANHICNPFHSDIFTQLQQHKQ